MHRARAAQSQIDADRDLGVAQSGRPAARCLQRPAAHQLHPQADALLVAFGAVHVHDVRVADAREASCLLQQPRVGRAPSPRTPTSCSSFSATSRWSSESQARKTSAEVP